MAKGSEDKIPDSAKIEDNDEETNENLQSRSSSPYNFEAKDSETEESSTDVEDKNKSQTSGTVPNYDWMKQRIKTLKQEVKITEMKTKMIKYEINNSKDLLQLQTKH